MVEKRDERTSMLVSISNSRMIILAKEKASKRFLGSFSPSATLVQYGLTKPSGPSRTSANVERETIRSVV